MKEKIRNWNPHSNIKVRYKKGDGTYDVWRTTLNDIFNKIDQVLKEHVEMDIKLTNRQLYYQLVGKEWIPNAIEIYKRICVLLTDTRYAGWIDWKAIEDKDRIPEKHSEWESVQEIIESSIYSYRLPRWKDQEYYLEMYCEKKAGINALQPIANKYHMYFGFNKGYSSASAMYDLAKRIKTQIENNKKTIILYFGDYDASGLDMIRDIRERITEFLLNSEDDPLDNYYGIDEEEMFKVIPVALTMDQIKRYNPPPNPAKQSDPRSKWYIRAYGNNSWELDSISPLELRKIAEDKILEYIDIEKYNAWIEMETEHKNKLREYAKSLDEDD